MIKSTFGAPFVIARAFPEAFLFNFVKHILSPLGLIATTPGATRQPLRHYPLKDFFRNSDRVFSHLADDDKTLGFMQPVNIDGQAARMNIFIQAVKGSETLDEPQHLTSETERDIRDFFERIQKPFFIKRTLVAMKTFTFRQSTPKSAKSPT